MYAGFNLDVSQSDSLSSSIKFSEYLSRENDPFADQVKAIQSKLNEYVLEGTDIPDGTAIQDDWFPEMNADIFISHSHKDVELAQGLAGWIYKTFGLKCFIDSNVWGYADHLLEQINSKYSNKREEQSGRVLYDHESCIAASKHVDTMLTIALYKMIDRCECIFLLNTDNSIQPYGDMPHDKTFSPWIYSEIVCSQLIRKKERRNHRKCMDIRHDYASMHESYTPAYTVTTQHLLPIDISNLIKWENEYQKKSCEHTLDVLYSQFSEIKLD